MEWQQHGSKEQDRQARNRTVSFPRCLLLDSYQVLRLNEQYQGNDNHEELKQGSESPFFFFFIY